MSTSPQGVGMSWECAGVPGGHGNCRQPGCRCACHYKLGATDTLQREIVQTPIGKVPTPPHNPLPDYTLNPKMIAMCPVCTKCGTTASIGDKYCRKDGTPLKPAVQHCGHCGVEAPMSDLYCAVCGRPLTEEVTVKGGAQ